MWAASLVTCPQDELSSLGSASISCHDDDDDDDDDDDGVDDDDDNSKRFLLKHLFSTC